MDSRRLIIGVLLWGLLLGAGLKMFTLPASTKMSAQNSNPNAHLEAWNLASKAAKDTGVAVESLRQVHAQVGAESTQIFYSQIVDGLPIAPGGTVTVDLGPGGRLLKVYNGLVPGTLRVTNERRISVGLARLRAEAELPTRNTTLPTQEGRALLWQIRGGDQPELKHAFEFLVDGRQILVDAENGQVLTVRDLRVL